MADQKRTAVDWEDVRVFLALGRHGSLSAAARALSVTHATISRRLQALEHSVGEKLVERRPDGYVLTSAGTRALVAAGHMDTAAQTFGRQGSGQTPQGLVRINASPALAYGFLIGRLAGLTAQHPALDIDLATDLRAISLDRHEADIAVRLGRPQDGDVIAKSLGQVATGFYGTAALCESVTRGAEPVFIGFDETNADLVDARWLRTHFPRSRVAFRTDNQMAQATAARAGAGLSLLPHYIGRRVPDLLPCTLGPVPPPREIWMLFRRQDRQDLAIRTVTEHLEQVFAREEALFEG
jgi:molybdate transport repressor ModE-like protein